MKTLMFIVVGILAVTISIFGTPAFAVEVTKEAKNPNNAKDIQAIEKTFAVYDDAWNKGDIAKRVALFSENSSVIEADGKSAKGKFELERRFIEDHALFAKGTRHTTSDIQVAFPSPSLAWVDASVSLTGIKDAAQKTTQTQNYHLVVLMSKTAKGWLWEALRVYRITPSSFKRLPKKR